MDNFADILVPKAERTTRYLDNQYSAQQKIINNVNIKWTSVPFKIDDKLVLDDVQRRQVRFTYVFEILSSYFLVSFRDYYYYYHY